MVLFVSINNLYHMQSKVNVFKWSYQARFGFNQCVPTFAEALLDVGFVIEGREDSELPEVILGCGRICRPAVNRCESWPPAGRISRAILPKKASAEAVVHQASARDSDSAAEDVVVANAAEAAPLAYAAERAQVPGAATETGLRALSQEQAQALAHGTAK